MKDALREAVRGFLEQHAPVGATPSEQVWTRLCRELGLTSLSMEDFEEVAVVLQETGRVLLQAPYLPTVVASVVLGELDAGDLLPGLHDGSTPAAVAWEDLSMVADAAAARLLLVATVDGLTVHTDFRATELVGMDGTRPCAAVDGSMAAGRRVGGGDAGTFMRDVGLVALAAESVGAARRCLELTVAHLLTREQFGRPLGSFQALRHRVADLTVELEGAESTTWWAARAVARRAPDLAVVAPLAKAAAADAFAHIAGEMIQLHGGIGFTWEHVCHLYFKRAWATRLRDGGPLALRREAFALAGW